MRCIQLSGQPYISIADPFLEWNPKELPDLWSQCNFASLHGLVFHPLLHLLNANSDVRAGSRFRGQVASFVIKKLVFRSFTDDRSLFYYIMEMQKMARRTAQTFCLHDLYSELFCCCLGLRYVLKKSGYAGATSRASSCCILMAAGS